MVWLIEKLTGKVAVYACAALLAVIALLAVGLGIQTSRHDNEVREHAKTQAALTTANTDLTRAADATKKWRDTAADLEMKLRHAISESERVKREGDAAVAAARRAASAAKTELASFKEIFATKTPTCSAALIAMEDACQELRDY